MQYIASWSGGKDSTASIILAHERGEPLDLIIFSEVMFDDGVSGELPEHIDFMRNKAIPIFKTWGYKTEVLRANKTYLDIFYHEPVRGKYKGTGLRSGFPLRFKCMVNKECKMKPIHDFLKTLPGNHMQYIGIASDEPDRLVRLKSNQISLLDKYGYTEAMAKDLCLRYGLLSPIYDFANRGGAGFARMHGTANFGICGKIIKIYGTLCLCLRKKTTS